MTFQESATKPTKVVNMAARPCLCACYCETNQYDYITHLYYSHLVKINSLLQSQLAATRLVGSCKSGCNIYNFYIGTC